MEEDGSGRPAPRDRAVFGAPLTRRRLVWAVILGVLVAVLLQWVGP